MTADIDNALDAVSGAGWEKWQFGTRENFLGFVYLHRKNNHADVLVVNSQGFAEAYRAHINKDVHPFVPELISWSFGGKPQDALQRLLALPEPETAEAPDWRQRFHGTALVPLPWRQAPHSCVRSTGHAAEKSGYNGCIAGPWHLI
ncbi:hypothetical protein [Amycolatopsis sp. cmx-11-12]|uniref:hypothetical protein n=1 Tax=Amycolatopsis sp. cmx-11-12 TaxID=2785795 RepID=UPI0039185AA3